MNQTNLIKHSSFVHQELIEYKEKKKTFKETYTLEELLNYISFYFELKKTYIFTEEDKKNLLSLVEKYSLDVILYSISSGAEGNEGDFQVYYITSNIDDSIGYIQSIKEKIK